ncbi:hypothetical protein GUITHDRAFT_139619 [Guillardia theta CCMP2712]|uniref:Uncharacterized protein n=1 Tax=Guillardia theta (strain CCMP2712) TaxID=905079 RepID=L1J831_GUITC|nr:hypothetical protein GUITHDRAFT_139619 [Guillardia theta CCMP2712]EKX44693.1 hypothetical protein GUITHDRAFT_139619 [Guillardia theta CCMP2712]|eukprot:XP_005831673.1 hypothetical protein GUITHDRAFT_139619 [Guillardia theta CCMP2712]
MTFLPHLLFQPMEYPSIPQDDPSGLLPPPPPPPTPGSPGHKRTSSDALEHLQHTTARALKLLRPQEIPSPDVADTLDIDNVFIADFPSQWQKPVASLSTHDPSPSSSSASPYLDSDPRSPSPLPSLVQVKLGVLLEFSDMIVDRSSFSTGFLTCNRTSAYAASAKGQLCLAVLDTVMRRPASQLFCLHAGPADNECFQFSLRPPASGQYLINAMAWDLDYNAHQPPDMLQLQHQLIAIIRLARPGTKLRGDAGPLKTFENMLDDIGMEPADPLGGLCASLMQSEQGAWSLLVSLKSVPAGQPSSTSQLTAAPVPQ